MSIVFHMCSVRMSVFELMVQAEVFIVEEVCIVSFSNCPVSSHPVIDKISKKFTGIEEVKIFPVISLSSQSRESESIVFPYCSLTDMICSFPTIKSIADTRFLGLEIKIAVSLDMGFPFVVSFFVKQTIYNRCYLSIISHFEIFPFKNRDIRMDI